jgi:site-specific DNA-adenine methylase
MRDPTRIALMAEELFKDLRDENLFALLQENWHTYKDPYIRSALFFLLNRCSENGLISAGKLDDKRYNPISLSYLKKFKMDNFHIKWDQQDDFVKTFGDIKNTDYLLFPIGKFNYNLFEYGKNKGYEMTTIHHKRFYEALQDVKDKWIVLYKNHPHVHILYKEHNIIMLDKYGREIKDKEKCEEMVIANF